MTEAQATPFHEEGYWPSAMSASEPWTACVQLPEDQWETYGKGQHLRGADAAFADRVLDELVRGLCQPPKSPAYRHWSAFVARSAQSQPGASARPSVRCKKAWERPGICSGSLAKLKVRSEGCLCACAQYMSFAEQVSAAGITKKLLLAEGKRMIRQLAVQTGTPMRVPPALIEQYGLAEVHARLLALLAKQFPSSNAIQPPWSAGANAPRPRRRHRSVAEEVYQADVSAEDFEQRNFSTSALQVPCLKPAASPKLQRGVMAVRVICRRVLVMDGGYVAGAAADPLGWNVAMRGRVMMKLDRVFTTKKCMQVAWSAVWGEGSSRCAMIAVSTKAGRVWLWRFRLPSEYSATAEKKSLADRFTLVWDSRNLSGCLCMHARFRNDVWFSIC